MGSEIIIWVIAMLGAGIIGGILAGLLGVGGGIVIVPVLYQILASMGIDDSIRMKIAVGSSLATIIVTSLISSRAHHKKQAVDWQLFRTWSVGIFIGVVLGLLIAGVVGGQVLTAVFATTALVVAIYMLVKKDDKGLFDGFPNPLVKGGFGAFVGCISTLMGIGGGTLSVPILTIYGYPIRKAVGTGAAIGALIAIPGTLGYLAQGIGVEGRPPFSLGYLNILAIAMIIPMTTLMAPVGAKIAHIIPQKLLQRLFSLFLFITSMRMFYDLLF